MAEWNQTGSEAPQTKDQTDGRREQAGQFGEQAKHQADRAKEKASHVGGKAADAVREAGERAKHGAAEVGDKLRHKGEEAAEKNKSWAADELSHASEAMRRAADHWHEEDDHRIAGYAEAAAERLEDFSHYLGSSDWRRLLHDVQDFGRRRPDLFLGGMFVAGLGIARFLKSTGDSSIRHDGTATRHDEQPSSSSLS